MIRLFYLPIENPTIFCGLGKMYDWPCWFLGGWKIDQASRYHIEKPDGCPDPFPKPPLKPLGLRGLAFFFKTNTPSVINCFKKKARPASTKKRMVNDKGQKFIRVLISACRLPVFFSL